MRKFLYLLAFFASTCYGQQSDSKHFKEQLKDSIERDFAELNKQIEVLNQIIFEMDSVSVSRDKSFAYSNIDNPISDIKTGKNRFDKIYSKERHLPDNLPVNINKTTTIIGFGFKIHPIYRNLRFHTGMDFISTKGEFVKSTQNGMVKWIKELKNGYGNHIIIENGTVRTIYAHLESISVNKGDKVKEGQIIGTVGNSGASVEFGLHYEVLVSDIPVNPLFIFFGKFSESEILEIELVNRESID